MRMEGEEWKAEELVIFGVRRLHVGLTRVGDGYACDRSLGTQCTVFDDNPARARFIYRPEQDNSLTGIKLAADLILVTTAGLRGEVCAVTFFQNCIITDASSYELAAIEDALDFFSRIISICRGVPSRYRALVTTPVTEMYSGRVLAESTSATV